MHVAQNATTGSGTPRTKPPHRRCRNDHGGCRPDDRPPSSCSRHRPRSPTTSTPAAERSATCSTRQHSPRSTRPRGPNRCRRTPARPCLADCSSSDRPAQRPDPSDERSTSARLGEAWTHGSAHHRARRRRRAFRRDRLRRDGRSGNRRAVRPPPRGSNQPERQIGTRSNTLNVMGRCDLRWSQSYDLGPSGSPGPGSHRTISSITADVTRARRLSH